MFSKGRFFLENRCEFQCAHCVMKQIEQIYLLSSHHTCTLCGDWSNLNDLPCASSVCEVAHSQRDVHVLHIQRSLLDAFNEVELRENRFPVFEDLLLGGAGGIGEQIGDILKECPHRLGRDRLLLGLHSESGD